MTFIKTIILCALFQTIFLCCCLCNMRRLYNVFIIIITFICGTFCTYIWLKKNEGVLHLLNKTIDENKGLSNEKQNLLNEKQNLLKKNQDLLNKNDLLSKENQNLLDNEKEVKRLKTELDQEVTNRVEQRFAELSKDIYVKETTIKELNKEISILLPIREQLDSKRTALIYKESSLQLHAAQFGCQMSILRNELEHILQDKQNEHMLQIAQKTNDQINIFCQTFRDLNNNQMEVIKYAIQGQCESVEAMRDVATTVAKSPPQTHNHYNDNRCYTDNRCYSYSNNNITYNAINKQNNLTYSNSSK